MGIFYFPCNFVYWRKVSNHEKIKNEVMEIINNNSKYGKKHDLIFNGVSSNTCLNFSKCINDKIADSVVWESIDELMKELNGRENFEKTKIDKSIILDAWYSKYDKNASVSCHNHSSDIAQSQHFIQGEMYRTTFSIIYVVNDENEQNHTEFIQPSMLSNNVSGCAETRFRTCDVKDISEGTVLIFPSNLYHQVNPIPKAGRVILSFNIVSTFK